MKFICPKDKINENISLVSKAVASKSSMSILECILIKAENGCVSFNAFDMEIGIETSPIETEVVEDGAVCLNAKLLNDIIKHLPNGMVSFSTVKNNVVEIVCGGSFYKVSGLPGDEFPAMPDVDKELSVCIASSELKRVIKQTIFAVSLDESKPPLTGVQFETKGNMLNVAAVDGFRVSHAVIFSDVLPGDLSFIVPSKTLNEVNKILSDKGTTTIYYTDKHVLFDFDSAVLISRLIEGEFFKYKSSFVDDYETLLTIDRANLLSCIERVTVISPADKKVPVVLTVEEDGINLYSENEIGNSKEQTEASVVGSKLEISFNPRYLMDILRVMDDEVVTVQFTTALSPFIIRAVDNMNYQFLVVPLKLRN